MYLFVLFLLVISALFEVILNKRIKQWYTILVATLFLMLCFRFGQGTDYFAYSLQFKITNTSLSAKEIIQLVVHGEPGWRLLMWMAKKIGLSFELFLAAVSLVMMMGLRKVINIYSPYKSVSLLLSYSTYYMTYFNSALRQGLVLGLFFSYGIELLLEEKYKRYFALILLLTLFHGSAAILLLLPILQVLEKRNLEKIVYIPFLAIMAMGYLDASSVLARYIPSASRYFGKNIRPMAIILRVIIFLVSYLSHKRLEHTDDEIERGLFQLYKYGFIIFITCSFSGNLSQRLTMPIKAIEIILLPVQYYLLRNEKSGIFSTITGGVRFSRKSLMCLILAVSLLIPPIEYFKNINSYIIQGEYTSWINVINYPYISVFEKDSIRTYRNDSDWTFRAMVD